MSKSTAFNIIFIEAGKVFSSLEKIIDDPTQADDLLAKLGYAVPDRIDEIYDSIKGTLLNFNESLTNLIAQLEDDNQDAAAIAKDVLVLLIDLSELIKVIQKLPDSINIVFATFSDYLANSGIVETFPKRLIDYLIITYLNDNHTGILGFLKLAGLVEITFTEKDDYNPDFYLHEIRWDRFKNLFSDPVKNFEESYNWGSTDLNFDKLMSQLKSFIWGIGKITYNNDDNGLASGPMPAIDAAIQHLLLNVPLLSCTISIGEESEDSASFEANLLLYPVVNQTEGEKNGLTLAPYLEGSIATAIPLNSLWSITLSSSASIGGNAGLIIDAAEGLHFFYDRNNFKASVSVSLARTSEEGIPIFNFSGFIVNIDSLSLTTTFNITDVADPEFIAALAFKISAGVSADDADSFIAQLFQSLDFDFAGTIAYSSLNGVYFVGSGGLEVQIPVHLQIGPINIDNVNITAEIGDKEFIPVQIDTSFSATLGPMVALVERVGFTLDMKFIDSDDKPGNIDFDIAFKPPNGLGLSINAGAVIGGGYLFFDFEKEEYAGAMELTIAGFISAKAIGLITTKMPDGSKGFSMLIIITAEFFPPFQLGYGFTLNGVGGLLGLHRTVLLDPLRDGVRTGAVNNIMFPTDVIANAPRIISDLKTIFPVYVGKFLIGPMAKIGWGTPSLITLSFGLIIEIPGNIAILGVLKLILPDEKVPIVKIQVAFVGTIDFDKKMLTFDASLYESSILQTMTLVGDMAVRLAWGDQPNFIMTVGGFHPSFTPPPLALPTLRRLAINILNTNIARIRVECYQAVTSNTVQFGARAEIYFDLKACSIDGHIGFDALFQFNPFYFIIELSAGFKLKAIGISLMTVRVKMSLEGPTPWHAKGTGKVSLLFFDISANFDKTWGQSKTTTLPQITILPLFLEQLQKKEQWNTVLSTGKNLTVSLRKLDEATESLLVLHPAGSLVLQQKLLPLKVNIDKIGNQKTADVKQLTIESASSGSIPLSIKEVEESFARAQYQNMSNAEKLSKPSFEKMQGGVEISMGDNSIQNGKMVRKKIEYELTIIDKEPVKPFPFGKFFLEFGVMFNHFIKGNSVSKSKLSKSTFEKLQPFEQKLDIQQELYSVAFQGNNKAFNPTATFNSEMEAQSFMKEQISSNPNLKKQIHIVPQFELQAS